ncbi:biotin/lipoyl-containing protein, partial [Streptomyces sp. S5]
VYEAAAAVRLARLAPVPDARGWSDPFAAADGWRLAGPPAPVVHHLRVPGQETVAYTAEAPGTHRVTADSVAVTLDGVRHSFRRAGQWLAREGDAWQVTDVDPVAEALAGADRAAGAKALTAPMPGTVTLVKVALGEEVEEGQGLLVVEAMKMEHLICAPHAGTVTELDVSPGTTVAMDQVLAVVTPPEAPELPSGDAPAETAVVRQAPATPAEEAQA